jgi:hypothetical protein
MVSEVISKMKKITLRLYLKNGKTRKYYTTDKIRRIYSIVGLAKFPDCPSSNGLKVVKAYVKVYYGKYQDVFNKMVDFYNEGYATDQKELKSLVQEFWNAE